MPLHDWQFWVVSLLALWGLWLLARPLLPVRKSSNADEAGCPNCASGAASSKKRQHRVALTVDRRRV